MNAFYSVLFSYGQGWRIFSLNKLNTYWEDAFNLIVDQSQLPISENKVTEYNKTVRAKYGKIDRNYQTVGAALLK